MCLEREAEGKGWAKGAGVLHPFLLTLTAEQNSGGTTVLKRSNAKDGKSVSS